MLSSPEHPLRCQLRRLKLIGVVFFMFGTLVSLVTTPIRLLQSLWNCRVLLNGTWGKYPHFSAKAALNSAFYWNRALNLYRYGRSGTSPYLGLGNYNLARCFHYSLLSLYAYWGAGAVTVLSGMFLWWMTHLIWLYTTNPTWLTVVMIVALLNPTFYLNLSGKQNYNVIGWAFFPLGLYGLLNNQWIIADLSWLGVSFGSFTVVVLAAILSSVVALQNLDWMPLVSLIPAILKLLTHLLPSLGQTNFAQVFIGIMKAIGMTDSNVKYRRSRSKQLWNGRHLFLLAYVQFLLAAWWFGGSFELLFFTGIVVYVVNASLVRFADAQTMQMLMLSLATASLIQHPSLWLLVSYWLLVASIPTLKKLQFNTLFWKAPPSFSPFDIEPFQNAVSRFLKPVKPDQCVWFAFSDPKGVYENVYGGYRALIELPFYIALQKHVHCLPGWWTVFELNYKGAPDIWGRDVETVVSNSKRWCANYVVIFQASGTELDQQWEKAGFQVLSLLDWKHLEQHFGMYPPYTRETPIWWLLKLPNLESPRFRGHRKT